jgi:hypothetical protein
MRANQHRPETFRRREIASALGYIVGMDHSSDDFEMAFHGDCTRSFGEETKQRLYMRYIGIPEVITWRSPLNYDFGGRSVIDIGGGPCSVLLKGENLKPRSVVVDPGNYPDWVLMRYFQAGIVWLRHQGENIDVDLDVTAHFDLALIYNCLQHCDSPWKIIANARAVAEQLKIFEWIDIPPHEGHPHCLRAADLERWTGQKGEVVELHGEYGCSGRAWILR